MKLSRKNVGRIATTFLATAMLASLTAVPAMAVDGDGTGGETGDNVVWTDGEIKDGNKIEIAKELWKREDVATPNVDFNLYVLIPVTKPIEKIEELYVNNGPVGSVIVPGDTTAIEGGVVGKYSFEHREEDIDDTVVDADNTITVEFDMSAFSEPGIYKYLVKEQAVKTENEEDVIYNFEGITNDSAYLYIYVEESKDDDGNVTYVITNAVLTHSNTETGKIGNLTNRYGVDDEPGKPDGTVNDLILTKDVTGSQGNTQTEWEFTIKIEPSNADDTVEVYHIVYGTYVEGVWADATPAHEDYIIENDQGIAQGTISLKDGESVRIYGLSRNDKYTISESAANTNGYTTTIKVNTVEVEEADWIDGNNDGKKDGVSGNVEAKVSEDNTDAYDVENEVLFTNDRDAVSPTGIVTNVAPYALLVVIAAAGCFVFLRKRDED